MSYLQRVFYVGEAAEPIEPVGDMTGHWVAYTGATGVAPELPAAGTLVGTGSVIVQGMYDDSGNAYQAGETLAATGVARILAATSDELPIGALSVVSVGDSLDTVVPALGAENFFQFDETSDVVVDTMGNCTNMVWGTPLEYMRSPSTRADGVGYSLDAHDFDGWAQASTTDYTGYFPGDFTIEFVVDQNSVGHDSWQYLVKRDDASDTLLWWLRINRNVSPGKIYIGSMGGDEYPLTVADWPTTFPDRLPHYFSLTYDSTSHIFSLYKDNLFESNVDASADATKNWGSNELGKFQISGSSSSVYEKLDELAMYNILLTSENRTSTYNAWLSGSEIGVITTDDCQAEFELAAPATSFRGPNQFRMNFRTADTGYTGITGDYAVGVPAPVVTPQLAVTDEAQADDIDADTRFYVMTYVNQNGYESAPGPVNPVPVHVGPTTSVQITRPLFRDVGYHAAVYGKNIVQDYVPIVAARLYRTNTGTTETGYQFIKEVGLDVITSLVPDVENQDLGELLVTEGWDVPPPVVTAGCKMANGTYLLVNEYTVYMSIPGVIYAFPVLYNQVVRDKLLHIEAVGTAAIALSDGGPYLIAGGSPDVMEIVKLPFYQACTSVRAVSVYLDLVVYPAQDGLMGVTAAGKVVNLTESVYEEHQWRAAWALDELISEVYDGVYYAWETSTGNGFAFHIESRAFQPLDINIWGASGMTRAAGLKYDGISDSFYMADTAGGVLYEWEPSGNPDVIYEPDYGTPLEIAITALSPYHYYKFDEVVGTDIVDSSGNNNLIIIPV